MSRPRLKSDFDPRPGLAAVALFVVMAAAFLNVDFPAPQGFGEAPDVISSIGAALFAIDPTAVAGEGAIGAESFLVAFIVIAVVLDAALDGSLMLAKRDDEDGDQ